MLRLIALLIVAAPTTLVAQTTVPVAPPPSDSGKQVVSALAELRGEFVGDGITIAFLPASSGDSITLEAAKGIGEEHMLPLIDCLADTALARAQYEGRGVSRGFLCYFAAAQTEWMRRHRMFQNLTPGQLLQAIVEIGKPDAEGQRRSSAIWREFYLAHARGRQPR